MKLETDMIYVVEFDDENNKHVFLEEKELASFLIEKIEEPGEKVKKAIKGEGLEGPTVVELQIPSDLAGDEKWRYGPQPFTRYLASNMQIDFSEEEK